MTERLAGKIVLITGGTTGIGFATARLFKAEGATVIVTGINPDNVAKAAADLGVEAIRCDVRSIAEIAALMADIETRHGRIDILFANAGVPGKGGPIDTIEESAWDDVFAINTRGMFFTVQRALRLMPDGGTIILTSSVAAHGGAVNMIAYSATKAAVRSMGRGLAAELMPRGIRVNTLTYGLIRTELFDKLPIPAEKMIDMLTAHVPMKRAASPEEAAAAALFLASSDSSFITGAEIKVTGGQSDL